MTTLLHLPTEIILEIIEPLALKDKLRLYKVCRRLRGIIQPGIYKSVDLKPGQMTNFLLSILRNHNLAIHVLNLRLEWMGYIDHAFWPRWKASDYSSMIGSSPVSKQDRTDIATRAHQRRYSHTFCHHLKKGSESSQAMLLLTLLPNIETLHATISGSAMIFRWRISELLRSNYMPKLREYECEEQSKYESETMSKAHHFPELLSSPNTSHTPSNSTGGKPKAVQGRKQETNGTQYAQSPQRQQLRATPSSLNLELISLRTSVGSLNALKGMLSACTCLRSFSIQITSHVNLHRPFATHILISSLRSQARNLRSISIQLPKIIYPSNGIQEEEVTTQSLEHFTQLDTLRLPIDLIIGPTPIHGRTIWSLLPRSLKELHLDDQVARTIHSFTSPQWTSQMFLRALSDGIQKVPNEFPHLRILTVGCLDKDHLKELRDAVSRIPSSQIQLRYVGTEEKMQVEPF
jgi:hypothetical protein